MHCYFIIWEYINKPKPQNKDAMYRSIQMTLKFCILQKLCCQRVIYVALLKKGLNSVDLGTKLESRLPWSPGLLRARLVDIVNYLRSQPPLKSTWQSELYFFKGFFSAAHLMDIYLQTPL